MDDNRHQGDRAEDQRRYRESGEIGAAALYEALMTLAGFRENRLLAVQASQLCLIDNMLNGLEQAVDRPKADDNPPFGKIALLSALSPMWIYAAYELLRTWRRRCQEVIGLAETPGLGLEVAGLEEDRGDRSYDRQLRAQQAHDARERPALVERMRVDLRRTEMAFSRLEAIRAALAKHEVTARDDRTPIAFAPTLARQSGDCGSMVYEVSNGDAIVEHVSRRDIADTIRLIPQSQNPSDEELTSFRAS